MNWSQYLIIQVCRLMANDHLCIKIRNQVFFYHCSTESGSVISDLSNEGKIVIKHKHIAVNRYLLDGKVPPLPLAITDEVSTSWIPVVLRIKR